MAEGADGEEEIQFLRTVSDAVCLFSNSLQLVSKHIQSTMYSNKTVLRLIVTS